MENEIKSSMNKNHIFTIFLLSFFLVLTLASCKGQRKDDVNDNGIKWDSINVTRQIFLRNNGSGPYCNVNVKVVYPVASRKININLLTKLWIEALFGTTYTDMNIQNAAQSYIDNAIQNYRDDAKAFDEDRLEKDPLTALSDGAYPESESGEGIDKPKDEFYSYNEILSDSVFFNRNDLISLQVKHISSKGGNVSYETYKNVVIDLKTGKFLSEKDIFIDDYEPQLRQMFIAGLLQQSGAKSVNELEQLGYFGIDEIVPNKNFLVNEKGITYIFNKGEYSAYPLDAPVIFLSYDVVRPLLRENSPISKLAGI